MLVKGIESCMLWHSTYTLPAQLIDCIRAMSEVQRTQHTQRTHYTPHSDRTQRHTAQHDIGHSTQHNTQHTHHIVLFGSVRKWRDPPRTGDKCTILLAKRTHVPLLLRGSFSAALCRSLCCKVLVGSLTFDCRGAF